MSIRLFFYLTVSCSVLAILFIGAVVLWPELFVSLTSQIISMMGVSVDSSKIIQFLGIPDIDYRLLLLITVVAISLINYRVVTGYHKVYLLVASCCLLLIMNLCIDSIWCRRLLFGLLYGPLAVYYALDFCQFLREHCEEKVMRRFLIGSTFLVTAILVIPGFYLPPFFDGIAGWYLKAPNNRYSVADIRIRFTDQHTEWFRSSFFNPITMSGRPYKTFWKRDRAFVRSPEFSCFLGALYKKAYPSLDKGVLPTQSKLGILSYPPHTFDKLPADSNYLSPEKIVSFESVSIKYDNGNRTENILAKWEYHPHLCGADNVSFEWSDRQLTVQHDFN